VTASLDGRGHRLGVRRSSTTSSQSLSKSAAGKPTPTAFHASITQKMGDAAGVDRARA
jgi:hypothetical protein